MFAKLEDLLTESDVEQKLVWPLLTAKLPSGLGYTASDIVTKLSTRRLEIGKGTTRKFYYPDYLVVLAGLPLIVVEAKAPEVPVRDGLDEARLYGVEINALFPSGVNPCFRVMACNGHELVSAPLDTSEPDIVVSHRELSVASKVFAALLDACQRQVAQQHADQLRRRLRKPAYVRPVSLVGGPAFQNEELPQNTFGATIVGDYGHVFNPRTREQRAFVVRNAYVPSTRRQRYVEPIDRLIRNAVAPIARHLRPIENTQTPTELTVVLQDHRALENQVLLLVGSVGVGKSTFVDYLSVVALPEDLRATTLWVRINLNEAPLSKDLAYGWLAERVVADCRNQFESTDFDELAVLERVFGPELNALRKGPLALLDPGSAEYRTRLADRLAGLQADPVTLAKGITRYLCAGPGRLLIVVLDNCDKRTRDEQLFMFQLAQWVQNEFRGLVILPLRDITYDLHRNEPPLDTALKNLVFRIEPPAFSEVLQARVRLALQEMRKNANRSDTLSFDLPNGFRVTYPASDQAYYLACILKSLYAHDRFVRQVMTGLAGRDVRRALEIFLDFCTSGHIGEDEIYKIRLFEGSYVLPLTVVARVLLRMHRRFYDGDRSYLKNLVQCRPDDALPDAFGRLAILHWFDRRKNQKGPAGVNGFHRVADLVEGLARLGHDALRVREELHYLVKERCLVAEHLRLVVEDVDLAKITAAGVVHLQLMANPDYLAACAEDAFLADADLARRVADRVTENGIKGHFARSTAAKNASEIVDYLRREASERLAAPEVFLNAESAMELITLREAEAAIAASEIELSTRLFVAGIPGQATADEVRDTFASAGVGVASVSLPSDDSGHGNRGFGFVEVTDGRAAMRALGMEGRIKLGERALRIEEAHGTQEAIGRKQGGNRPPVSERVFVGNLAYECGTDSVRELFTANGVTALDVFVATDRATGRSRGYAFVSLASIEEAQRALAAIDGVQLRGRRVIVRPADPRDAEDG